MPAAAHQLAGSGDGRPAPHQSSTSCSLQPVSCACTPQHRARPQPRLLGSQAWMRHAALVINQRLILTPGAAAPAAAGAPPPNRPMMAPQRRPPVLLPAGHPLARPASQPPPRDMAPPPAWPAAQQAVRRDPTWIASCSGLQPPACVHPPRTRAMTCVNGAVRASRACPPCRRAPEAVRCSGCEPGPRRPAGPPGHWQRPSHRPARRCSQHMAAAKARCPLRGPPAWAWLPLPYHQCMHLCHCCLQRGLALQQCRLHALVGRHAPKLAPACAVPR